MNKVLENEGLKVLITKDLSLWQMQNFLLLILSIHLLVDSNNLAPLVVVLLNSTNTSNKITLKNFSRRKSAQK